jgi:hypothetical protein
MCQMLCETLDTTSAIPGNVFPSILRRAQDDNDPQAFTAAIPGKVFPSKYSSIAPPPVET